MAKVQFYPLDVVYKVVNNRTQIYLFGRTTDNKQICVIDENFEPYFYVLTKQIEDVQEKLVKIRVERDEDVSSVTKTEVVHKKLLSKETDAIKVYTKLPRDVPVIRDVIKEWEMIDSIHEYDIQFTRRYLIDKSIVPSTLVEVEGSEVNHKFRVPVFKADKITSLGDESLREPRVLAFDIETYNPDGESIQPEKNPMLMVAFYGEGLKKVITWKKFKTKSKEIEFADDEAGLIKRFKEIIREHQPDILTGYFSDGFDIPYIKTRAEKHKIKLDLGLDLSEVKVKAGKADTSKITGIVHLDIFKFIFKVMRGSLDTDSYKLDAVASELLGQKKKKVDLDKLAGIWDNKPEELERYCDYNLQDSFLTYELCKKMFPTLLELVKIVGLPIYAVNRMGFSQLVEGYLLKQAQQFNEIAPNKPHYDEISKRKMNTYKGAFVFEPKPGLYKDIVIFDYRSLYPSIISSHNISPGTLNCSCCEGEAETTPGEKEHKHWFCKKIKGFVPTIIGDLITRRMRIKEIIKKKEDKFLSARDQALKLLANSFYGYLGFFGARWYSIECARSVTGWGRFYIQDVISKARKNDFNVLYSDTDSVFLALGEKTRKDAEKFLEAINLGLPGLMEMEYEGFYPNGIFVSAKEGPYGAKKKYALMSEDGSLKIKGFEAVRRNWSFIAKEVQENVLNIILKENDTEKALTYVKTVVKELRNKEIPLDKVVIHTKLQKELGSYDAVGPHVAVAKEMKNKGVEIGIGSMVRYVVTSGTGRIRDRAKIPEDVKDKDYDFDYYINNQVIPSVEKIFEVLGFTKEELLRTKEQRKLERFFG
jgi:DNA polymerase I